MSRIASFGQVRQREEWRPVVGCEGRYEVSDLGRVRSIDHWYTDSLGRRRHYSGHLLSGSILSTGYLAVVIERKTVRIHTLVLAAFVGPRPSGMFCLHRNGKKRDNRLRNLRYGTPKENNADALRHGAIKFGSQRASSKLTEERVLIIRALNGAVPDPEIARVFGVAAMTVKSVRNGHLWSAARGKLSMEEASDLFMQFRRGVALRDTLPVLVGALALCRQTAVLRRRVP